MHTTVAEASIRPVLRRAAVRATLAASVHDTQPWRFELRGRHLEIHADPSRQLRTLDPVRRQLTVSCGCALFNARVAVAAGGWQPVVQLLPVPAKPTLLARIGATRRLDRLADSIAAFDDVVELRQTNLQPFSAGDVPSWLVDSLESAAAVEGAHLHVVRSEHQRIALARLAQHAADVRTGDPAQRAELRAWTSGETRRVHRLFENSVSKIAGIACDTSTLATRPGGRPCLLVLWTDQDRASDWLRAGEALERVLLEVTRNGLAANLLTQLVEARSRQTGSPGSPLSLGVPGFPQALLRVGRAPLSPAARRRRLVDVLFEQP